MSARNFFWQFSTGWACNIVSVDVVFVCNRGVKVKQFTWAVIEQVTQKFHRIMLSTRVEVTIG